MSGAAQRAPDYEAEYNNRARTPEHPAIMEGWARDAAAYRERRPPTVLAYGPGERERMDLFEAEPGPAVMFIHGGYWQALDRSWFSHLAAGLNARGVSVAVPSYDLCPAVTIAAILEQMRAAAAALGARTGAPVVAAGHSAGGHLAACLLGSEPGVSAAWAVSGLFELEPLVGTSINAALGLDAAEARRLSPRWRPVRPGTRLDCVVGGAESAEYLRQSRDMAAWWSDGGGEGRFETVPGANHFTVIAPLADPDSPQTARLAALAR